MKTFRKILTITLGLSFFAYVAYQGFFKSPWEFPLTGPRVLLLVALTLLYSLGICLVGLSWISSLRIKAPQVSMTEGLRVYCLAGIGKYLPGNLGHHVGRIWMLSSMDISKVWVSTSLVIEFFFAFAASFLLSIPCLLKQSSVLKNWSFSTLVGVIFIGGVLTMVVCFFLSQKFKNFLTEFIQLLFSAKRQFLRAFFLMLLAFFLMALTFALLGAGLIGQELLGPFLFAFPLAWILGYLTPGSPAGMGTRELALVLLLNGYASQSHVSQVAILMRIVSLSSDIILFLGGQFFLKKVLNHERKSG